MSAIRTDYFTGNRDLLPDWLPESSLLVKLLRCLMDNHIQDAVYTFHHPYLLPYYAYVLRKPGLSGNLNLTVIEGVTQTNVVAPITNRSTDVFDNPLPFAWYDGELLMVFNLHMGIATGGTPYSYLMDNILRITVDGTLVPLTGHRVGGRAYWYAGKGWKLERIEPPGLFVPGQHSYITCYYERRPPFPTVKLGSDVLEYRTIWNRADEMLRLCGSHRGSFSAAGAYFHKIRGKLPGYHLFGLGCELGLTRIRTYIPVFQRFDVSSFITSVVFSEYGSRLKRVRYPQTLQFFEPVEEYAYTSIYALAKAWWDPAPSLLVGALSDEVT